MRSTDSGNTSICVVGIDGCRLGWAVARWRFSGSTPETFTTSLETDLTEIVDGVRAGEISYAAIDMPMGLFDDGPRLADSEARAFLSPRGSTIFSAPARCTLNADSYQDACELSRAAIDKALSIQAFNLVPKIRELDSLISAKDQTNIVESHPECSFARMADGPLLDSKHTAEGRGLRWQLLVEQFGEGFAKHWEHERPNGISPIDVLDAWSLAITARQVFEGDACHFGSDRIDPKGKVAHIWY